jgi:flagellar biosynthesis/type III secretory pathway protein FliH
LSSIIKSSFISLSEQKKTIEVIQNNDAKIINPNFNVQHHQDGVDDGFQINRDLYRSDDASEDQYEDEHYEQDQHEEDQYEEQYNHPGLPQNDVIEDVMKQAEEILEGAKEAAVSIEAEANTKGYDEGFKAGKKQALKEELKLRQKLKEEIEAATQDRKNSIHKMQPKVAEIIQRLVLNMIGIQKIEPEIILFLIKLGLEEVDLYGDLIIKVSSDDYDEVIHNKDKIVENLSDKLRFEILKDNKLNKNDCIIETSLGSINCSLNERMDGLLRQLELIEKSYSSNTPIDLGDKNEKI